MRQHTSERAACGKADRASSASLRHHPIPLLESERDAEGSDTSTTITDLTGEYRRDLEYKQRSPRSEQRNGAGLSSAPKRSWRKSRRTLTVGRVEKCSFPCAAGATCSTRHVTTPLLKVWPSWKWSQGKVMTDAHYGLARQLGPLRERASEVGRVGRETAAASVGANAGPPLAYRHGDRAGSEAQRGMGRRDPQDPFYSCGQESVSAFVNANILVRHLTGAPPDIAAMSLRPGCRCTL